MFQRIQTIYLLVAIAFIAASYFFAFGHTGEYALCSYGAKLNDTYVQEVCSYWFHLPLFIVLVILLISVFSFKNRKRQMALIRGTFILFAISFALLAFFILDAQKKLAASFSADISLFLVFAAMIFTYLALRAIAKDEALVQSVDRIR